MVYQLLVPLGAITEKAGRQEDDALAVKIIEASFEDLRRRLGGPDLACERVLTSRPSSWQGAVAS